MDRQRALELLPEAHALALRLVDEGADTALIASQLEIEREAVPLLVRVAEDKLTTLLGRFPPTEPQTPPSGAAKDVTRLDQGNYKERLDGTSTSSHRRPDEVEARRAW